MGRDDSVRAVFHDRAQVEEAVRALELEGVRRPRIHVDRADATGEGLRVPPERSHAIRIGLGLGAAIGLVLATLWLARAPEPAALWLLGMRVVGGAGSGALIGGLVALVVSRLRHQSRYEQPTGYPDYLVRVDAPDRALAEHVRDLLERAGGQLVSP